MGSFFFAWLLFSGLVGLFASTRGRSGVGWGLLSLFLSPLICWLILLMIPNLEKEEERVLRERREARLLDEHRQQEHEKQLAALKAITSSQGKAGPVSVADEIAKLADLRDKGLLTDEEFSAQKAALLSPGA